VAANSYGRDLTREEIEVWRSLYYKAEDALTPKGIEQLPILCDMALRTLDQSNGPSSEQWWRDASRERPHRDRLVIAWSEPYGAVLADRMTNNPDFGWSCSGHVTHWMPLPDTPDATKDGKP